MPYDEVFNKYKRGELRSGSGGKVTDRKQAIAIYLSEKRKADAGNTEYQSRAENVRRRRHKLVHEALSK